MRCKLRSLAWRGRRADIMQTKEAAWSGQASFRPEQLNPARLCSNTILAGDESNATACRQLNTDGRIRRAHKTLLSLRRNFSPTKCQSGCCGSRARIDLWANIIKLTITLLDIGASNMSSQLFLENLRHLRLGNTYETGCSRKMICQSISKTDPAAKVSISVARAQSRIRT